MRRPTVADVLEAVTYVGGVDPLLDDQVPRTIKARVLAICALRNITECSWPEIGRELGYADHKTAMYHYAKGCDWDELRAVVDRVSAKVGA